MVKFFVISDVHGFYDEMIEALEKAGFDINNPNHWVIGCGDYTDRGPKSWEVIRFLHNLPRKILIRGNHEELFEACCYRGEPYMHDLQNGTAGAISDIARFNPEGYGYFPEDCVYALKWTRPFRESLVDYFETKNYIFVHSWVPVVAKDGKPAYYTRDRSFEFNPNWRDASPQEWSDARWGNPFDMAARGLMPDKTIVFGHWHSSTGWAQSEGRSEFGEDAKFDPYYGEGFIAIDACTAYSGKCTVVVIEDEFMEGDVNGNSAS